MNSSENSPDGMSFQVYAEPGVAKEPLHQPLQITGITRTKTVYINRPPPSSNS